MKLTLVSNYINHHQIPVSEELYKVLGVGYTFIQTEPMTGERKRMGWEEGEHLPYVVCSYDDMDLARKLILESDVVIFGGARDHELILPRIMAKKLTFVYSERIYKEGQWKFISPRGLKQKYHDHIRFAKYPVYLLCAGGYVASDFHLIHAYPGKMLRFGYFPEFMDYGDAVHSKRIGFDTEIVWAGRCIDWKHPEVAIEVMKHLKDQGIQAHMTFIGGGELLPEIHDLAEAYELTDSITFTGFLKPAQVREYMRRADVFLFTSDYREGWGVVLNEAMNSGCAVVANEGIGAVPYLIEGECGYTYPNGDIGQCKALVTALVKSKELSLKTGRLAYERIRSEWNPQIAAKRLIRLSEKLLDGMQAKPSDTKQRVPKLTDLSLETDGPCSIAPVLSPGIRN